MEQKYKRFAHVCMCVYAHVLSNVFLAHVLRSNTCAHVLSNVFLSSFVHQPNATVHQSSLNTLEHACTASICLYVLSRPMQQQAMPLLCFHVASGVASGFIVMV